MRYTLFSPDPLTLDNLHVILENTFSHVFAKCHQVRDRPSSRSQCTHPVVELTGSTNLLPIQDMASNSFYNLVLEVKGLGVNTSRAVIQIYFTQCCSGLEVATVGKRGDTAIVEIKQISGDSEFYRV